MSYPLSKEVQVGETTLASQYNQLRADAVYLGGDENTSATLQQLLMTYQGTVSLSAVGSQISLHASAAQPCSLMIGGKPAVATQTVSVSLSREDHPQCAQLYLTALKTEGTATFTLKVREAPVESDTERPIGRFFWDADLGLVRTLHDSTFLQHLQQLTLPETCQGRLTLAASNPFPTADIPMAESLYFTPCGGNKISLYHPAAGWTTYVFPPLMISLAGLSSQTCYDVFVMLGADGKPTLSLEPWSNLTALEQVISWQDGIPVLAGFGGGQYQRYVGTIGLTAAGRTADTLSDRNIWNYQNQIRKPLRKLCTVAQNQNAESNRWVPYAQDTGLSLGLVIGMNHAEVDLYGSGSITAISANASALGIGIDIDPEDSSMTVNAAELTALEYHGGSLLTRLQNRSPNRMLGKRRYHLISYTVNDTHTFNGTNYAQNACGLSGWVLA